MPSRRTRTLLATVSVAGGAAFWAPAADAESFRRCCFRVQVEAQGSMSTDWGADPAKQVNGYHKLRWGWATRQLMSYSEHRGFRQLGEACLESRCARDKGRAWMSEESNIVQDASDPSMRYDRGSCNHTATAGRDATAWVNSKASYSVAISSPKQNALKTSLLFVNVGANVLGQKKFEDRCWFGLGSHASTGHEPPADLATRQTNSIWEAIAAAPKPALFRQNRRFVVNDGGPPSFSHDASYDPDRPHTTHISELVEVRFTPFPPRRLLAEIQALNRLR